ncbi:phosphopantetheine-binding protein, partial [Streptomyces sp. UNOB3_S3]|uniref:phosphopantetheine-binding protein n=1 Tax=Streptomyces sp. UNOB3_S3 TaxID=2871682 RepID=UPI001E3A2F1B
VRTPVRRAASGVGAHEAGLAERLAGLSAPKQEALLLRLVAGHVATVLGHGSAEAVDGERGFLDLGMSSLTAVELRNRLNAETGLRLPTTAIFDHPTPLGLVRHLREQLDLAPGAGATGETAPVFAELGLLEAAMAASELDGEARTRLLQRLKSLQWKLDAADDGTTAEDTTAADPAASDLEAAETDDEMFDLIDKELGLA